MSDCSSDHDDSRAPKQSSAIPQEPAPSSRRPSLDSRRHTGETYTAERNFDIQFDGGPDRVGATCIFPWLSRFNCRCALHVAAGRKIQVRSDAPDGSVTAGELQLLQAGEQVRDHQIKHPSWWRLCLKWNHKRRDLPRVIE
nr:nonstructural protein VP5 [porcine birnavirus]